MKKLLQKYLDLKLRAKLLLSYMIIITVVVSLVGGASYYINRSFMEKNTLAASKVLTAQVGAGFQTGMRNLEQNLFDKSVNSPFINFQFSAKANSLAVDRQKYQRAVEYLLHSETHYRFVYFADLHGTQSFAADSELATANIPYASPLTEQEIQTEAANLKQLWGGGEWSPGSADTVYLKRAVYNIKTLKYSGYMVVGVDHSFLQEVFRVATSGSIGAILAYTAQGQQLYPAPAENVFLPADVAAQLQGKNAGTLRFRSGGLPYIASYSQTDDNRFMLVNLIPVREMMRDFRRIQLWNILVFAVAAAVSVLFGLLLSNNITSRVKLLLERIAALSKGDFTAKPVPEGKDEIGMLAKNFNQMAAQINQLMIDIMAETTRNQQAEYQMLEFQYHNLQAQINPHFLYNVLDSVNSLAKLKNDEEICRIISLLSQLLRESINQNSKMVSLEKELSYTQKYTELYKIMYGDKVSFHYEVQQGTENVLVPNFIVQPIVENAILHGINQKEGQGIITVRARQQEGYLVLEIADNGVGMDEDTLAMLRTGRTNTDTRAHIGLPSVMERLRILFGEDYSLVIHSKRTVGTRIRFVLPYASQSLFP